MNITIVMMAAILLLAAALGITIKISGARKKRAAEIEEWFEVARKELEQQEKYNKKREEAQKNAEDKKASLHTGDTADDFNNSIELLHDAGKNSRR